MSGAACWTPIDPKSTGLAARDWAWSLGLHGGLVLMAVVWAFSPSPAPEVRPLRVTLAWQARMHPGDAVVSAAWPVPSAVPTAVAPPPKAQRATAQPVAKAQLAPPSAAPPVLLSAPALVVPVASAVVAPQVSTAPAVPLAPQGPAPTRASSAVVAAAPPMPAPAGTKPAIGPSEEAAYQRWRDHLMQALHQHKRYPPSARRMGQTGTVLVQVRLSAAGELLAWELAESSGFKALDSAAEKLVRAVVQALPSQLTPGRATELRIPVVYELTES